MNELEKRIREFASDPENIMEAWALLKVGKDKGATCEIIMRNMLCNALFRFHGIPLTPQNGN